ncbi:MAG: MFS transporter [Lachnospiraceae bacterium]|nr:MFS transporter [Lachnospiraceae bacterium]
MKSMEITGNRKTRQTITCFLILFLLGLESGGFQISLLKIVETVGLSSHLSGVLVSGQYGAIVIMPLLVGHFADRKGRCRVLSASCLVFALGCAGMSVFQTFGSLFMCAFAIGSGYSVCESVSSALLGEIHEEKAGKYMNLSQCFFSLGAMAGPQLLELGRSYLGWNYQSLFLLCGIVGAVIGLGTLPEARRDTVHTVQMSEQTSSPVRREILYLAVGFFVYTSLECGISYYLDGFVTTELQCPEHAANILSLFWMCMALGRLLCGLFYQYRKMILICSFLGAGCCLGLLLFFPCLPLGYFCFSLIGLSLASVWPNLMSLGVESCPGYSAQAAGILSTGGGIGAVAAPVFLGMVMDGAGLRLGFGGLGLLAVIGALICVQYYHRIRTLHE